MKGAFAMIGWPPGLALPLLLLVTPAIAGILPIEGAYGNAAGCSYFMTGDADSDDLLLLTPDTFATAATGCDFEHLVSVAGERLIVSAICSSEGEGGRGPRNVTVVGATGGYTVEIEGLAESGPLAPCPGSAAYTDPLGVQI